MAPRVSFVVLFITVFTLSGTQDINTNAIDDQDNEVKVETQNNDRSPFEDVANAFMQGGNLAGGIEGMLTNFIKADQAKTSGQLLPSPGDTAEQMVSKIGSILADKNAGAALDPSLLGNVLQMMAGNNNKNGPDLGNLLNMASGIMGSMGSGDQKQGDGLDMGFLLNLASNFFTDSGENPINLIFSMFNSFLGPDARAREEQHADHAYLLPPFLEKLHIYFDHFRHTELYKAIWRITGGESFFNTFATNGKFDFNKFFDLIENQNFRRHWLRVITGKITKLIAMATDPKTHKKYLNTAVSLFNGFLKSLNFPKSALFDVTRPDETLTNAVNYFFKKYLNMDIDSRRYIKPAVKYVTEVIELAQKKGYLRKDELDSTELSHKLTDTINLEMIEPIARVWRAYRFAKKVPECSKYVMCLINQEDPNEVLSLPGLKSSLSKSASMVVSWFLSQKTGVPFFSLYTAITDEEDCTIRFIEKCNDFHLEEIKVTTEYVHNEL